MILRLVAASLTCARMALMLLALMLLAACTAASSVRFGDQLAAMVRAADDSSAGRALRQGSDYVSFSWEDAKGGARTAVLERMDTAICGPQPCWLLTSAAVGRSTTKLIDTSEMPLPSIFDDRWSTRATRFSLPSSPVSDPGESEEEGEQERIGRVEEMGGAELRALYKWVCARDHALDRIGGGSSSTSAISCENADPTWVPP